MRDFGEGTPICGHEWPAAPPCPHPATTSESHRCWRPPGEGHVHRCPCANGERPAYVEDRDIIEHVKVMPLQPGDLVVFELVAGTSQSEAHEFMHQLETLARQRPEITFCAMHELEGVRIVRQAEIPAYVDPEIGGRHG